MIKTYEAVFNNANNKGVYGISLVEDPAMQGNFIALSKKAEIKLQTVNEEQRIIMGLVLEPNKPVYRNQDGEEFNIVFSEQVIKDLSHNFFKQGFQTNSSIEHSDNIEGVTFVESWIVENSEIDKSANFGFSYPKGSWIATMKIDSDEVWNDYVKTGKVLGFSVDAFVTLKEVNLKSNIEMAEEKKDMFADLKIWFTENILNKKEIKLGSFKTSDGVEVMFDGELLEVGGAVWVQSEDGSRVALPVGEVQLEDGRVVVIAEEGVVAEIKEATQPDAPAEMSEPVSAPQATAKEVTDAIKSVLIKYSEDLDVKFNDINTKLSEVLKENETLKGQIVELSEQPASKPIKSKPEQSIKLTKKGRILEAIRNNKN